MAGEEHHEFTVTIPAHTPQNAPVTVVTALPPRRITEIKWTLPPGSLGTTGFRITMGKVQVIPVNFGAWIVRDGDAGSSALSRLPDSGAWEITGYNTGNNPHSIYVTFYAAIIQHKPVMPVPLSLGELQSGYNAIPAHH